MLDGQGQVKCHKSPSTLAMNPQKYYCKKRGIIRVEEKQIPSLQSKQCPNCLEPNKPNTKFCINCKMVLSIDNYTEALEKQKEKESKYKS